ncbi:hypothetical protein ACFE04_031630 [Oxalis oulophora]
MTSLSRELVFLILQFLDEEKFKDTVHRHDNGRAVEILAKDLKVFSTFNEELFKEITMLLTLTNFRENEQLSKYGDTKSARAIMLIELKKLIEANPLFRDKLQFPSFKNSRLRTLINQSLNWQHQLCKNPRSNPDIKTLFVDHSCGLPNGARAPSPVTNSLMGSIPKVGGFQPLGPPGSFQPAPSGGPAPLTASLAGWMANPSSMPHPTGSVGPIGLSAPNNVASMLKRPRTPTTNNLGMDYQTADSENVVKRSRPFGLSDEVNNLPVNILPVTYSNQAHGHTSLYSSDDLPKAVAANINQGSAVKSMDFHPVQQTVLLVGTNIGDISIWEVGSRERLVSQSFKVWDVSQCSMALQASLANEYTTSVNRVIWSPDGNLLGVAYSKHIVHIFSYHGGEDLRKHLEIDAHVGNVSDLAFCSPNKQLSVITCGEDKSIKVWDAVAGTKQYTFDGHEAPVYSVCPHHKETIQFIFSTAVDGKIKAWLYDNMGSRVDYDAPGQSCTRMAYSADGTRLFSCGTNKEGESHIVEWNESEGAVKRSYHGIGKRSMGIVQFDTTKNRFLAAGDEFQIKFWDMDNLNLLSATDADGGLPASPCLRFNKEGMLLAVSTSENGIKILGNADGVRLLRSIESRAGALDGSRLTSGTIVKGPLVGTLGASSSMIGTSLGLGDRNAPMSSLVGLSGDPRALPDVKPRVDDESEKSKIWKLTEFGEPTQLRTMRLSDSLPATKIIRLIYTNSGSAILALTYNATHKLWKWQRNERNPTGKRVTGLAFSNALNILVSSGADAQVFVWSMDGWEKQASKFLQMPTGRMPSPLAPTRVHFHQDQVHVLAVHETQLAIFEAPKLECIKQWSPRESSGSITDAMYSCDSQLIYASIEDGSICVLASSTLRLRCRVDPAAYLPCNPTSRTYPTVVAAHPSEPNQFAIGLNDGGVHVLEPPESDGKWGTIPPHENGAGPSISSNAGSDQQTR